MSFLESVQHGIEKASQEASRLAKIQHLHSVASDLLMRSNQESHDLIAKAMELFQSGKLTQSELLPICLQIATFQQHIAEVQAEIQKIQAEAQTQAHPAPQAPTPPGYPPYPTQAGATPPPPGYPYAYPPYPGAPAPTAPAAPPTTAPTPPASN